MRLSMFLSSLALGCLFFQGLFAQDTLIDKTSQEVFSKIVSFESQGKQYQLQATGVATRKKLVVKVYSIASYLQTGIELSGDKMQGMLSLDYAKQLSIKWLRDVSADKVQEAFLESFRKLFRGTEYTTQENNINTFIQLFSQGAHKGDEFVFRSLPGGFIEVLINNKRVGSLSSKEFARGLWEIWFGQKSVVDRASLVSELK